jgi:hypothetical protein
MKTFAAILAFLSLAIIAHGAGSFPIKNGVLQNDLNAGGHAITNATDLTDTNGNSLLGGGGGPTNGITASQAASQIAATNNNILINLYDAAGTALAIGLQATNYALTKVAANAGVSFNQTLFNPTNTIIGVNVLEAGAKGGTNDDTALFNTLLKNYRNVFFDPSTNYTAGALFLTNHTRIWGNGARINFLTNLTSSTLFNIPTNVNDWTIEGLRINGGNTNDCFGAVRATNTLRFAANPGVSTRGVFIDDYFYGFDTAVKPVPMVDGITVQELPHIQFIHCEFATNGIGLALESQSTSVCAEYFNINGQNFHDNSYGAWIAAGNDSVRNCGFNHNFINICVDGSNGFNPGHAEIANNTINHPGSRYMVCSNLTVGETISGNLFRGTSAELALVNCKGVVLEHNNWESGCRVGNYGISGGANFVVYNNAAGDFGINANGLRVFDWALSVDGPTTNIVSWGNFSWNQLGFDDPYFWNPYATNTAGVNNGISFTNLNASSLASGIVPTARLGSGSASSSTFLRGDQQWATPAGSGNVSGPASSTDGNLAVYNGPTGTVISNSAFSPASFAARSSNLSDLANAATARANLSVAATNYGTALEVRFANGAFMRTNTAAPFNWRFENTNGTVTLGTNNVTQITIGADGSIINSGGITLDSLGGVSANKLSSGNLSANAGLYSDTSLQIQPIPTGHAGFQTNDNAGHFGYTYHLIGDGTSLTNSQGYGFANTNQLLGASALGASSHIKTDSGTNLISSEDATGYTNTIYSTNFLATTNIAISFNSPASLCQGVITNGPDVFFVFNGGDRGSWSFLFTTNVTMHYPAQVKWLWGAPTGNTNSVISFTCYGGTNLVEGSWAPNQ